MSQLEPEITRLVQQAKVSAEIAKTGPTQKPAYKKTRRKTTQSKAASSAKGTKVNKVV